MIGDFNNGPKWMKRSHRRGWADTLAAWAPFGLVQHGDPGSVSHYNSLGGDLWVDHLLAPPALVTECTIHRPRLAV